MCLEGERHVAFQNDLRLKIYTSSGFFFFGTWTSIQSPGKIAVSLQLRNAAFKALNRESELQEIIAEMKEPMDLPKAYVGDP